jgi:hypothetical protein
MKEKPILSYAHGSYQERLKPFLFWVIVAAIASVVIALVVAFYPQSAYMLIRRYVE